MPAHAPILRPPSRRHTSARPTRARRGPVGDTITGLDCFCGWGGSSQGLTKAGIKLILAANHDARSIECHSLNYPDVEHRLADVSDIHNSRFVDPANFPAATVAWFSPSCKHHSKANSKKVLANGPAAIVDDEFDDAAYANSERSRVTMVCPLRYAAANRPEIVIVENVVEAAQWGPKQKGKTAGDGSTFKWWLSEWDLLGYEYEILFLNSQFFPPCPQSRDRMYVVLWRRGNTKPNLDHTPQAICTSDMCQGATTTAFQSWKQRTKAWPLPQWGRYGAQYIYRCTRCTEPVEPMAWPAYTAVDWSDLGTRLCDRDKPLAPKTMARIRGGLMKFGGGPPIIIPAKATWGTERSVMSPLACQTSQQEKSLVVRDPFLVKNNGSFAEARYRAGSVGAPAGTVTANPTTALATTGVTVAAAGNTFDKADAGGYVRAKPLEEPGFTQHTTQAFGLAHMVDPSLAATFVKQNGGPGDTAWHNMNDPLGTITSRDVTALSFMPWIEQFMTNPVGITEQLATVMSHSRQALLVAERNPRAEISDAELMQVRFRMLRPDPELRVAMAFAPDYRLIGNASEMTSGLGNAVTPPVSCWIADRCMASLDSSAYDYESWDNDLVAA